MKRLPLIFLLASILFTIEARCDDIEYPIKQVSFTNVKITPGTFWGQRLKASREVTIPLAFSKCEETGRYTNFSNAAAHLQDPTKVFKIEKATYPFDDTDPYKTIEGASYLLQTYPDKELEKYVDSVIMVIASGQEPDGYIYTPRTQNPTTPHDWSGPTRWSMVEVNSHEFYNLGHLCEAAVAHYRATGKRSLLDIAIRYADCVCREIGEGEGQMCVVPGHQIAEMGLAKLYTVTGNKRYLDMAKFFLDKRGYTTIKKAYSQSHRPVVEQDEAVGHAVRAGYMYAGMADVAALTGDKSYIDAIDRIWENIVSKKLYITGGVGATHNGEAFRENYYLPNLTAYCETCAAIAQVYLNYRLFLLHGHSKYYDVLERTLYNGVISGVSIDGGSFFYPNPLQSTGKHQRQPWFGCACCPSNVARFIPSVPQYVYAVKDNNLFVNLFMGNSAEIEVNGKPVAIKQTTDYPWSGDVNIDIEKSRGEFALNIRIPGWVRGETVPSDLYNYADGKRLGYSIKVNGEEVKSELLNGYFVIQRKWKRGDKVEIHFDLEPRLVKANHNVQQDRGLLAIERGPLVYCAESADNECNILNVLLNRRPKFDLGKKEIAGSDIVTLTTDAQTLSYNDKGGLETYGERVVMIPYYAWAHRGKGNMAVWLPYDISKVTPTPQPTIASQSSIECSRKIDNLTALNDRVVPTGANDSEVKFCHWWPTKNSTEWLTYTFKEEMTIHSSTTYWLDDLPCGECTTPKEWHIYYKDNDGKWTEVELEDKTTYPSKKDAPCTVHFKPIKTKALKLEVIMPEKYSCGLYEWSVE